MLRLNKWVFVITGAILGSLIIFEIGRYPDVFAIVLRAPMDIPSAILCLFAFGFALLLINRLRLIAKEKTKNTLLAELLMGIFFLYGSTTLVQGILLIVRLHPHVLDFVLLESVMFFVSAGTVLLTYFNIEVFGKGISDRRSKLWFYAVVIFALVFATYLAKDAIFYIEGNQLDPSSGTPGSQEWEGLVFGTPAMAVVVYTYLYLAVAAFRVSRKAPEILMKRGFRFIGLGGICAITGFMLVGIGAMLGMTPTFGAFAPAMNILMSSLVLVAMSFLYYGFTLPMKDKNRKN